MSLSYHLSHFFFVPLSFLSWLWYWSKKFIYLFIFLLFHFISPTSLSDVPFSTNLSMDSLKLQNVSFLYSECYFLEDQDNLSSLKSVLSFLISGNYIAGKDKVWVGLEYKISENCRNTESWHLLTGSYSEVLKKLGTRLETKEASFRVEGRYCLPTKEKNKILPGPFTHMGGRGDLTLLTEGHQSLSSIVARRWVKEKKNFWNRVRK